MADAHAADPFFLREGGFPDLCISGFLDCQISGSHDFFVTIFAVSWMLDAGHLYLSFPGCPWCSLWVLGGSFGCAWSVFEGSQGDLGGSLGVLRGSSESPKGILGSVGASLMVLRGSWTDSQGTGCSLPGGA